MDNEMISALDIIYPRRCPVCDGVIKVFEIRNGHLRRGGYIHRGCAKSVKIVRGSTCMKCGKPLGRSSTDEYCSDCVRVQHIFDRGFSVFEYRSISGSVYRFKYLGRREYAVFYAAATKKLLGDRLKVLGIEAVIPVPMYRGKERKRGYNQAAVYAKAVSKILALPYRGDVIARKRDTVPMKELDATGRRNNLKNAFNIVRNDVKFKCVLLIDDIYTTGTTIDELSRVLRVAGVERVYFLTIAIGRTT
ncbi:MAG: ComF family protein [Butyrivibrio sp.]|nr:ComF family protein [Butyrivibrio sp.]